MLFRKREPFVRIMTVASMSTLMAACPELIVTNPPPPDTAVLDTDVSDTDVSDTEVSDTDGSDTDVSDTDVADSDT